MADTNNTTTLNEPTNRPDASATASATEVITIDDTSPQTAGAVYNPTERDSIMSGLNNLGLKTEEANIMHNLPHRAQGQSMMTPAPTPLPTAEKISLPDQAPWSEVIPQELEHAAEFISQDVQKRQDPKLLLSVINNLLLDACNRRNVQTLDLSNFTVARKPAYGGVPLMAPPSIPRFSHATPTPACAVSPRETRSQNIVINSASKQP